MKTNLENIFLIESNFSRKPLSEIQLDQLIPDTNIEITTKLFEEPKKLIVSLNYKFNLLDSKTKKTKYISYNCSYQAEFGIETIEDIPEETFDRFGSVNGAAVLFPFVREDLMDRSVKSGFQPILLPLVNFVQIFENKLKEKEQKNN